jgi:dTDP-4-amino-4,6-dideoxygalactose transaminase
MPQLFLSPPHLGADERRLLLDAIDSNWVAPLGPHVDAFERELAQYVGTEHAVALSSGTAALHLALVAAGIGTGDEVWVSSFTFAASANPVCYVGARPTFVDSDRISWNLDPSLLAEALADRARRGHRMPRALILVHLYGQSADTDRVAALCAEHGILLIEDAAEALGARYKGRAPGVDGWVGFYSFNGNKIITTSGGGMLVTRDSEIARRVRMLSTQAREPAPHYQHAHVGYNYRLSNLLAAVGRGQLRVLEDRVAARRRIFERYRAALAAEPGITFMPEARFNHDDSSATRWLTCLEVDPIAFGATREQIRLTLAAHDIESRPVWKPLHLQPVFADCDVIGGSVCRDIFDRGLCLPSGSAMTDEMVDRVSDLVLRSRKNPVSAHA